MTSGYDFKQAAIDLSYHDTVQAALTIAAAVDRGEYVKLAKGLEDENEPDAKWLIESRGDDEFSVTKYVPATQWRPIESAPHEKLVLLSWYDLLLDDWFIEVGMATHGKLYPNGVSTRSSHSRATHWMPLPPPPQKGPSDE